MRNFISDFHIMYMGGMQMKESCYSANIKMHEFERTFKYDDTEVMVLSIKYPIVNIMYNPISENLINNEIGMNVNEYIRYSKYLYKQAVDSYEYFKANNYPFNTYNAYMEYKITYNENCHLSMYYDKYEFTGGAHGTTTRASNNWYLCNGMNLCLNYFFPPNTDYRQLIINELLNQADYNMQQNPGIYFDDYKGLIIKNFNQNDFYLTPKGITFYFQQYDIAPYSTGIVEFVIPYDKINWYPKC